MKVYQEEAGGTFEADGVRYDLNGILRDSARLPVNHIALAKLKWCLGSTTLKEERVEAADFMVPILITPYMGKVLMNRGKPLVVDGEHRTTKAIRHKRAFIAYRLVPAEVMKRHIVKKA